MPQPDRLLATVRRAVDLTTATRGRTGKLVALHNCTEVLVAGDLHGHVPNFQHVLKAADLAAKPTRHLVLQEVIHGPFRYPNGSDKSHQLVDLFAALKCQYPDRVHLLPGNHELAQWTDRPVGKADEGDLNDAFRRGVSTAYGAFGGDVYAAYLDLFRACPFALRTPNRVLMTHSLPPLRNLAGFDGTRLETDHFAGPDFEPGGIIYGLLWGRDTTERTAVEFLRRMDADLLVTGHIKTDAGFEVPNPHQLIVDGAGSPCGYVLFPADRPIAHAELVAGVVTV